MTPVGEAKDLALAAAAHARAAGRLIASGRDMVRAVHLARRHIKRTRSLLRALAPLSREAVARENGFLRAFSHQLAPLRDAHALEEAARQVGLAGHGAAAAGAGIDLPALGKALQKQARVIARLAPAEAPKHYLAMAVARAYRRARRAYARYRLDPAAEPLHEARKRIKDCLHLVEALDDRRPKGAPPKPRRLDELGELMGAIRDLDLLSQRLHRRSGSQPKLMRIAARQARLERAVARAGEKAFRPRPSQVEKAWRGP
ncbi:MAG: CHAD domain-containing protein [Phreatobacter sp.]